MSVPLLNNKKLPDDFIASFNKTTGEGMRHIDEIVAENNFEYDTLLGDMVIPTERPFDSGLSFGGSNIKFPNE